MKKHFLTILTLVTLVACGGGGDGDNTEAVPAQPQNNTSAVQSSIGGSSSGPNQTAVVTASGNQPTATSTSGAANESAPIVSAEETPPEVARTSELTASEDFDFTSSYDISVNIDLAPAGERYLNICNRFERNGNTTEVDYGSCVLQAPLDSGQFVGTLSLTNDVRDLVVAIWSYSGAEPTYHFWSFARDGITLTLK